MAVEGGRDACPLTPRAARRFVAGKIEDDTRLDIVRSSCPGPGACGGMYTANTMASAIEALGMSVPYSSSIPAWEPSLNGGAGGLHPEKVEECRRAVEALTTCIARDIKPRDIMTMKAFENAVRRAAATASAPAITTRTCAFPTLRCAAPPPPRAPLPSPPVPVPSPLSVPPCLRAPQHTARSARPAPRARSES